MKMPRTYLAYGLGVLVLYAALESRGFVLASVFDGNSTANKEAAFTHK